MNRASPRLSPEPSCCRSFSPCRGGARRSRKRHRDRRASQPGPAAGGRPVDVRGRLDPRPAGQGGPRRPHRSDARRGEHRGALVRGAPGRPLPDGRRHRREHRPRGHRDLRRDPRGQPGGVHGAADRDGAEAGLHPVRLRAQQGPAPLLPDHHAPGRQRRAPGPGGAAAGDLRAPPLRPRAGRHGRGVGGDHPGRRTRVLPGALHPGEPAAGGGRRLPAGGSR